VKTLLFTGKLVRLAAVNPETDAEAIARWSHDSEYSRLHTPNPSQPLTAQRSRRMLEEDSPPTEFVFAIRALADDVLIGTTGLWLNHAHGDAWFGIGIGERTHWGRGYGTDAARIVLRYAFTELNLYRVSLDALATNARAIRSYEKAGFTHEGRTRHTSRYDGRWFDDVYMGILREEWERIVKSKA